MECRITSDFPADFSEIVMVELARELLLSARHRLGRPPPPRTQVFEVLGAFAYAIAPVINNIDSADRGTMRDWFVNVLDLLVEELRHRSHPNDSGTEPAEEGRAIPGDARAPAATGSASSLAGNYTRSRRNGQIAEATALNDSRMAKPARPALRTYSSSSHTSTAAGAKNATTGRRHPLNRLTVVDSPRQHAPGDYPL